MAQNNRLPLIKLAKITALSLSGLLLLFTPIVVASPPNVPAVKSSTVSRFDIPFDDGTPLGTISAISIYVYDLDSGTKLYEKNSSSPTTLVK